jgi:hypothetical protein
MADIDPSEATAQDVVDAMRFALMAQKDPVERLRLFDALLEFAPETDNDRGISFVLNLIAEGSLKLALVEG